MKHKNIAIFIPNAGCKQRCSFCSQSDISGSVRVPTAGEVYDILLDAVSFLPTNEEREQTEIAFFGGSFTAIGVPLQESYLKVASGFVKEFGLHGIRISTRPDAIDASILDRLKGYGVTAIELGAQSMDDEVLAANKRGHTSAAVIEATALIRSYGFSLGLQMMVGLYKSNEANEYETMEKLLDCKPDTMRIYPTVVIEGTELALLMKSGLYEPITLDSAVGICGRLLMRCHENHVKVIKLGLHSSEQVEGQAIGGAYHQAFRELCEGELYFTKACKALEKYDNGTFEIAVSPTCISKMVGQKKKNICRLTELGYIARVVPDALLETYEIAIREVTTCS